MSPMKSKQVGLSQCCRKSPRVLRSFLPTSRKIQIKELDMGFPVFRKSQQRKSSCRPQTIPILTEERVVPRGGRSRVWCLITSASRAVHGVPDRPWTATRLLNESTKDQDGQDSH